LQFPPQRFAEHGTTPIDLTEHAIAAILGDGNQAIDPLTVRVAIREL
jgi:hypothetical protein